MKKNILIIAFLLGSVILPTLAQKQEKTITIEVHNNWNQPQTDAPVVISLRELQMGFKVKSAVVMEGSDEIPSQLDDLNRDRKMDELAFVTELPAQGRKTFRLLFLRKRARRLILNGFMLICLSQTTAKGNINGYRLLPFPVPAIYIVWYVLTVRCWNRS